MCRRKSSAMQSIEVLCVSQNLEAGSLTAKSKLLLGSYRRVCWATLGSCTLDSDDRYGIMFEGPEIALEYLQTYSPTEERAVFERKLKSLFDSRWVMELVDDAMMQVKEFPDTGNQYFEILTKCYLSSMKYGKEIPGSPFTTGEDGLIQTENILPGSYTVEEIIPKNSFYVPVGDNPQSVTVTQGKATEVTFANCLRPGKIELKKIDITGSPLAGAKFYLEWSEDGSLWWPIEYSDSESPDLVKKYSDHFRCPEAFLNIDGKILVIPKEPPKQRDSLMDKLKNQPASPKKDAPAKKPKEEVR